MHVHVFRASRTTDITRGVQESFQGMRPSIMCVCRSASETRHLAATMYLYPFESLGEFRI